MHLLLHWLVNAAVILGVAHLLPGLRVKSFSQALGIAAIVGVLGLVVGPILTIVSLPLILLTLGAFAWFLGWLVNALLLFIASKLMTDFEIDSTATLLTGAALITVGEHFFSWILHLR